MPTIKTNKRIFQIREGDFEEAYSFAESLLKRKDVNDAASKETLLIFEALMERIVDWGLGEDADLEIAGVERLGEFRIRVSFEGKVFAREKDALDTVEDQILDTYGDKLDYSYHLGRNEVSVMVVRSHRTSLLACAIAALCAIGVYLLLSFMTDEQQRSVLLKDYVFPLETMYANAMLMIGAPMTFFSLLKNLTDTYVVSQKRSGVRELQTRMFATSALAILLAFMLFFALSIPLTIMLDSLYGTSSVLGGSVDRTFSDIVTSFITPSIFEPFAAVSPVPLMVVALLCTYALCSAGKYFDSLRYAMMACYTLFSRMLHLVIAALPFFCFLAILDLLLDVGILALAETAAYFIATSLGVLLLFSTYAIRLRVRGVKVIDFSRKLGPLLRENLKIDSAINAVPYNARYCSKVFKIDWKMLKHSLPVLAEINLDGNCFLLAFFTLAFALIMETQLSWLSMVGLAVLVLFLSLGAPNQPGGLLIGMLIIATYLGSAEQLCIAIISEAFFGGLQNLINVVGDIVMVAIEDSKKKSLAQNARDEGAQR